MMMVEVSHRPSVEPDVTERRAGDDGVENIPLRKDGINGHVLPESSEPFLQVLGRPPVRYK